MDGLREAVIRMLGGEKVRVMAGSFQNDMTNIRSRDDVLTLMVHLGYLAYDAEEGSVFIPNEEVRQEFVLAVTKSRHNIFKGFEGDILFVGVNYDEKTKKHTCRIERQSKRSHNGKGEETLWK